MQPFCVIRPLMPGTRGGPHRRRRRPVAASRVLATTAASTPGERDLRGYFDVAAADARAAATIATSCPHLEYGGTIAVKPIVEH